MLVILLALFFILPAHAQPGFRLKRNLQRLGEDFTLTVGQGNGSPIYVETFEGVSPELPALNWSGYSGEFWFGQDDTSTTGTLITGSLVVSNLWVFTPTSAAQFGQAGRYRAGIKFVHSSGFPSYPFAQGTLKIDAIIGFPTVTPALMGIPYDWQSSYLPLSSGSGIYPGTTPVYTMNNEFPSVTVSSGVIGIHFETDDTGSGGDGYVADGGTHWITGQLGFEDSFLILSNSIGGHSLLSQDTGGNLNIDVRSAGGTNVKIRGGSLYVDGGNGIQALHQITGDIGPSTNYLNGIAAGTYSNIIMQTGSDGTITSLATGEAPAGGGGGIASTYAEFFSGTTNGGVDTSFSGGTWYNIPIDTTAVSHVDSGGFWDYETGYWSGFTSDWVHINFTLMAFNWSSSEFLQVVVRKNKSTDAGGIFRRFYLHNSIAGEARSFPSIDCFIDNVNGATNVYECQFQFTAGITDPTWNLSYNRVTIYGFDLP